MAKYNTNDAVQFAYDGNASSFREAVSGILFDKIRDAVYERKSDIAMSMMDSPVVEEEVGLEEGTGADASDLKGVGNNDTEGLERTKPEKDMVKDVKSGKMSLGPYSDSTYDHVFKGDRK